MTAFNYLWDGHLVAITILRSFDVEVGYWFEAEDYSENAHEISIFIVFFR